MTDAPKPPAHVAPYVVALGDGDLADRAGPSEAIENAAAPAAAHR